MEDIAMKVGAFDRIPGWFRAGIHVTYEDPLVEVHFPSAPVVVEPISNIGILLYLG
jgi:hypothetical protein